MKLFEAFEALNALNEETFAVSDDGIEKLNTFMQEDDDIDDVIDIIDPDAETEEELKDSYVGKVILDCCVCHSKIYKDKEEVELDEEGVLANIGEECPYCYSSDGFKIVGEIAPFGEEAVEETELQESLVESKAGTMEKPMSSLQGTLSNVMSAHQDELSNITSKNDALAFLDKIEPEVKNKGYLTTVKEKVAKLPDFKVLMFLYNIILKGDGMGKLESLTESHRGDRHRVTAELFDILSEHGFDTDAEDVENYVFAARDIVFEDLLVNPDMTIGEVVSRWFKETKTNYPEDLESLTKLDEYTFEEDLLVRDKDGKLTTTSQDNRWGTSKEWDYNNQSSKNESKSIREAVEDTPKLEMESDEIEVDSNNDNDYVKSYVFVGDTDELVAEFWVSYDTYHNTPMNYDIIYPDKYNDARLRPNSGIFYGSESVSDMQKAFFKYIEKQFSAWYERNSQKESISKSKSIKEDYSGTLTDDEEELLQDIANRYVTSHPISGKWETETQHELEAIADELNVSEEDAKKIMIDYLGFSEEQFNESKSIDEDFEISKEDMIRAINLICNGRHSYKEKLDSYLQYRRAEDIKNLSDSHLRYFYNEVRDELKQEENPNFRLAQAFHLDESKSIKEEYKLYEKNDTAKNNAIKEWQSQVEQITNGKSLSDIAFDLTTSLTDAIEEYKVASTDHDNHELNSGSERNRNDKKGKQVIELYAQLIKGLKKPTNFYAPYSMISKAITKILEGFEAGSDTLSRIEDYGTLLNEVGHIQADKKIVIAALKDFYSRILNNLNNDYKRFKSKKYAGAIFESKSINEAIKLEYIEGIEKDGKYGSIYQAIFDNKDFLEVIEWDNKIEITEAEGIFSEMKTLSFESLNDIRKYIKKLQLNESIKITSDESKSINEAPDADGILYDYEVGAKYNDIANAEMKQNAEYRKKISELKAEISKLVPEVQKIINTLRESGKTYYDLKVTPKSFLVDSPYAQIYIDSKHRSNNVPAGSTYLIITKSGGSTRYFEKCSTAVTENGEIITSWDDGSWTDPKMSNPGYATIESLKTFLNSFDNVKEKFYSEFNTVAESKSIKEAIEDIPQLEMESDEIEVDSDNDYDYVKSYVFVGDTDELVAEFWVSYDTYHNTPMNYDVTYPDKYNDARLRPNSGIFYGSESVSDMQKAFFKYIKKQFSAWYERNSQKESISESKSIKEDINNLSLDTDDTHLEMNSDENGKVTITTEPLENKSYAEDEVVTPVSDETKSEIEANSQSEDEVDFEEFDEESFDELGENYLKENFNNVVTFKTKDVLTKNNKLVIEGLITFDSGNIKKTSFTFDAKDFTREGLYRFTGKNNQLKESSFDMVGRFKDKKFICESLTSKA